MAKVSMNISIDPIIKKQASELFSQFGLDLSTAITLFFQQSIREKRIPFEVRLEIPHKETIKAINEVELMKQGKKHYKTYDSFQDIIAEIK